MSPGPAVPLADQEEAQVAPPAGELAESPVGLDAKPDLAGLVILREHEPFEALLEVAFEGVIAIAEAGPMIVGAVTNLPNADAIEEPKAPDLDLEQHVAPVERSAGIEVSHHDARVRELVVHD